MPEDKIYENPTPVAVAIMPVIEIKEYQTNQGLVALEIAKVIYVKRGIEPKINHFALPGGFVNKLERIEAGGVREIKEETGLMIEEEHFKLLRSEITPNNRNLIFGVTNELTPDVIHQMNQNLKDNPGMQRETAGFLIEGLKIQNAAFPLHQKAISLFLDEFQQKQFKFIAQELNQSTIDELIVHLKNDGFISNDFEFIKSMRPQYKLK